MHQNGTWLLDYNGNFQWDGAGSDKLLSYGGPGYAPVLGDWNGSGSTKIGAHKDGRWLLDYNGNFAWDGPGTDKLIFFGGVGHTPTVGDWNGSGTSKVGAYKDGLWVLDVNGNFAWDPPRSRWCSSAARDRPRSPADGSARNAREIDEEDSAQIRAYCGFSSIGDGPGIAKGNSNAIRYGSIECDIREGSPDWDGPDP